MQRQSTRAQDRWQAKGKDAQKRTHVVTTLSSERSKPEHGLSAGFGCRFVDISSMSPEEKHVVLPAGQTLASVEAAACKALGFAHGCQLQDLDGSGGGAVIRSEEHMQAVLEYFMEREDVRQEDALQAALESIRSRLNSTRADLHFAALHTLWELACRPENHKQLALGLLFQVVAALRSEEPHVAAVAAATVWELSECDETRARLPVAELVPALIDLATRERSTGAGLTLGERKARHAPHRAPKPPGLRARPPLFRPDEYTK